MLFIQNPILYLYKFASNLKEKHLIKPDKLQIEVDVIKANYLYKRSLN